MSRAEWGLPDEQGRYATWGLPQEPRLPVTALVAMSERQVQRVSEQATDHQEELR